MNTTLYTGKFLSLVREDRLEYAELANVCGRWS